MSKVKPEHYKNAYTKLYNFLRTRHPEILKEYRQYVKEVKKKAQEMLLMPEEP